MNSSADILGCTQHLCKPSWPLLRQPSFTDEAGGILPQNLGQAFRRLVPFGINNDAANVLQSMVDLTLIIDSHCRGIHPISDFKVFIERRNAIQHSLMSLSNGDELESGEVGSICLYESIRHAAIIYSVAVTFPLPPVSGIFRKLAGGLQNILEESKLDPCWQLCPKTLLWILLLGGIAASGTMDRVWYVQNLVTLSSALNLIEWKDVAEEVENYLWLESACDTGGSNLWDEMKNARLLDGDDNAVFSGF